MVPEVITIQIPVLFLFATAITTGTAPFTMVSSPQQPFTNLNACAVNGAWTLNVQDDAAVDVGTLIRLDYLF